MILLHLHFCNSFVENYDSISEFMIWVLKTFILVYVGNMKLTTLLLSIE